MFGGSNKKAVVQNNSVEGATKAELTEVVAEIFPDLLNMTTVLQIWDGVFNDFVDIGEERIPGPMKVRVNQVIPVTFTKEIMESGGL